MKVTLIISFIFLLLSGLVQGCATTPTGAASATYGNGILQATYDDDVAKTYAASRAALRDFNMSVTNAQKDATGGEIHARRPDGTTVDISLRAKESDTTIAGIRVGTLGDEELSRAISRRIEEHL